MSTSLLDRRAIAVGAVGRHETHGSWALVTPDRAYKITKPVVLPFADDGTLERGASGLLALADRLAWLAAGPS